MGLKAAIHWWLTGLDVLTTEGGEGLLGSRSDPWIYPHAAPARLPPRVPRYLVFRRTPDESVGQTMDRAGSMRRAVMTFEAWGRTATEVEEVVDTIRAAFKSLRGKIPARRPRDSDTTDAPTLDVRVVSLGDESDDFLPPLDGSDVIWHVTEFTVAIQYVDPIGALA